MTPPPAPTWPAVLGRWSVEPTVVALLIVAALAYRRGLVLRSGHAGRGRRPGVFGVGLAVIALALLSPIDTYGHALLSVHMVQHLLLVLVAAPLLVISLPDLRLPPLLTNPLVTWIAFAATGWAVHLSPLFDLALRHPPVHAAEHALFLGSGILFWLPVLSLHRLSHGLRLLYLAVAMPQNTFLALAIYSAREPLYEAYVELGRTWGPSVLDDQRLGAGIMWVAGDLALLVAVLAVAATWPASEEDEAEVPLNP